MIAAVVRSEGDSCGDGERSAAERDRVGQTPVTNVSGLTLVVLRCADLERTRRFYEALGLTLVPERHAAGPRHYSARVGETLLEFYPDAGGSTRGLRLGLRLVDVPAAMSALTEIGAVVRPGRPPTIDDPDGHRLELHSASAV
jgi:lactoylglutathione lyase